MQGTSCCRTIHRKIPGYWPKDGGGDVQITFTKQSVDVIAKVVNMKGWVVAPTMTRGAKKVGATLAGNMSQLGPNVPTRAKRVKKKILKPQPKETVPVEEEEHGDASIRRTQQGRDNIKKIYNEKSFWTWQGSLSKCSGIWHSWLMPAQVSGNRQLSLARFAGSIGADIWMHVPGWCKWCWEVHPPFKLPQRRCAQLMWAHLGGGQGFATKWPLPKKTHLLACKCLGPLGRNVLASQGKFHTLKKFLFVANYNARENLL